MTSGIYEILNTSNGKRYIGSAVNLIARQRVHKHHLRHGSHHSPHLQRAWDKHGETAFEFRTIQTCPKNQLLFQEQRAIHGFQPEYNICPVAGSALGVKHTAEFCRAQSQRMLGKQLRLGITHTIEARAKMSVTRKGVVIPPEVRAKMGAALRGRPLSPKHRAAISASNRGRPGTFTGRVHSAETKELMAKPKSQETRIKMSVAQMGNKKALGYKHSPEFGAAVSARMRGKTVSPETREKIAAALRGRKQSPELIAKRFARRDAPSQRCP